MSANPAFELLLSIYNSLHGLNKETLVEFIRNAPQTYSTWWTTLLKESPEHLVIETGLIVFIGWLVFVRRTVDPVKSSKNASLSKKEEEWLIETWTPEPLAAPISEKDAMLSDCMMVSDLVHCVQFLTYS